MRARHLAALGVIGILSALAVSCVAIVGADEERKQIVHYLCGCTDLTSFIELETCKSEVSARLNRVSDEERAAWMRKAQDKNCFKSCKEALACYRTAPSCSPDVCRTGDDRECCDGFTCKTLDDGTRECLP